MLQFCLFSLAKKGDHLFQCILSYYSIDSIDSMYQCNQFYSGLLKSNQSEMSKRRIEAFECWCWSRVTRILWTAKKTNVSSNKSTQSFYLRYKLSGFSYSTLETLCKYLAFCRGA